jgi:hypothetical protein
MDLGAILIWGSWLYITVAIVLAKVTYRHALKANPAYIEVSEDSQLDPFKFKRTADTLELIMDDSLELNGFAPSVVKMARIVKIMYFTAPIAFVLFIYGIFVR